MHTILIYYFTAGWITKFLSQCIPHNQYSPRHIPRSRLLSPINIPLLKLLIIPAVHFLYLALCFSQNRRLFLTRRNIYLCLLFRTKLNGLRLLFRCACCTFWCYIPLRRRIRRSRSSSRRHWRLIQNPPKPILEIKIKVPVPIRPTCRRTIPCRECRRIRLIRRIPIQCRCRQILNLHYRPPTTRRRIILNIVLPKRIIRPPAPQNLRKQRRCFPHLILKSIIFLRAWRRVRTSISRRLPIIRIVWNLIRNQPCLFLQ